MNLPLIITIKNVPAHQVNLSISKLIEEDINEKGDYEYKNVFIKIIDATYEANYTYDYFSQKDPAELEGYFYKYIYAKDAHFTSILIQDAKVSDNKFEREVAHYLFLKIFSDFPNSSGILSDSTNNKDLFIFDKGKYFEA